MIAKNEDNFEYIDILHTGDIHSHLENYPQIKKFLLDTRKNCEELGHTIYSFDLGDMLDRFNPVTEVSQGKNNVLLANQCHYDAVTIGNNEGLTLKHDDLKALYTDANFQVVLSNLKDSKQNTPSFCQTSLKYVSKKGTKVAILALTAAYQLTYPKMNWHILEVEEVLQKTYAQLRQENDVLILLSHLGKDVDFKIANQYEFDLILGSHTHHYFPNGEVKNNTLITALGRYGEYVGHIKLKLAKHQIIEKTADTYPTEQLAFEQKDEELISRLSKDAKKQLSQKQICVLKETISRKEQVLDSLDALTTKYACPVAMISTGMFLCDLPKGVLSKNMLLSDLPHAVHPAKYQLTGQELLAFLKHLEENKAFYLHKRIHGMGFRGNEFGQMCYQGIKKYDNEYYFLEEKIDLNHNYEFIALDHYYFLPYFKDLQKKPPVIYQDCFLRELMEKYYEEKY